MLKSFLNFDNFITPRIITIIYWMQIVAVFFIAFNVMFSGIGAEIGGVLTVRIMNELVIVLFRIQEHLKAIREQK